MYYSNGGLRREHMNQLQQKFPADFTCLAVGVSGVCGIEENGSPIQLENGSPGAISFTVGHLPKSDVEIFDMDVVCRGGLDSKDDWKVFIVYVCHSPGAILNKLHTQFPNATVVGGIVDRQLNVGIIKDGSVSLSNARPGYVLAFKGEGVVFNSQVSMACRPLTQFCTVKSYQNFGRVSVVQTVRTADGREISAASLDEIALDTAREGNTEGPLYLGLGAEDGLTLYDYELSQQLPGTICVNAEGRELDGLGVRIYGLDGASSRDDIKRRLQAGARACASQSRDVLGGLLFTCCGRTSDFFNGDPSVEVSLFTQVFPRQHIGGFLAYGEIGPKFQAGSDPDNPARERAQLQGYTAVYGIFFVPKILAQLQAQSNASRV